MRKGLAAILALILLLAGTAGAEEHALSVWVQAEEIRPGQAVVIAFTVPKAGECSLCLLDDADNVISVVSEHREVAAGENYIYWNGTWNGVPAPEGLWRLRLEQGGQTADTAVLIGAAVPRVVSLNPRSLTVRPGETRTIQYYVTEKGTVALLRMDGEQPDLLATAETEKGAGSLEFTADLPPGVYELPLTLTGEDGVSSEPMILTLTVTDGSSAAAETEAPTTDPIREKTAFTPAYGSPWEGRDTTLNYWTLPMDISDEQAVWEVLTAPVTVLDTGKKNAERTQVILRREPREDSEGVGVVTCVSQGVHVLERGDEWSLVECYSSSFHDSPILNWNVLVQGYVPTAYLREVVPNQQLGLVVDKLTQRLYVFQDGHLLSTLLVSTGLANKRQPYNETRSGEFLLVSKVGEFSSDNLRCAMALRFNDGDLLHEVPYDRQENGSKNYGLTEPKLGSKASHGCIRVQRQLSPEGVNMQWLWTHYAKNTKIIVWEDWQGRQYPAPEDNTLLYFNPNGGKAYHLKETCFTYRKNRAKMQSFTYRQLDTEPYLKLKRCEYCAAPPRKGEIAEINELYAPFGDHDPVMTDARKDCPKKLRK